MLIIVPFMELGGSESRFGRHGYEENPRRRHGGGWGGWTRLELQEPASGVCEGAMRVYRRVGLIRNSVDVAAAAVAASGLSTLAHPAIDAPLLACCIFAPDRILDVNEPTRG